MDRFIAVAEAGGTIALIVTKDPEAAMVYYFRDPLRAFETYERLGKLNAPPAVVYISPEDGIHRPAAHLHSASAPVLRAIGRLARLVSCAASPEVHPADDPAAERRYPPDASEFSRGFVSTSLSGAAGDGIRSAAACVEELREGRRQAGHGRCRGAPGRARQRNGIGGFRARNGNC